MSDSSIGVAVHRGRHGRPGARRRLPDRLHAVRRGPPRDPPGRDRRRQPGGSPTTPPAASATSAREPTGRPSPPPTTSTWSAWCRQPPAPRDGRGPAGRRQARALREAAGADPRGRRGHGRRGRAPGPGDRVGFTFRRSPAIEAIRERARRRRDGPLLHFNGHYWCDYGVDPNGPMSWRYKGGPGSGALADIGSHLLDLAEFLCGPIESVRGAALSTFVTRAAVPLGRRRRPRQAAVSDVTEPVENEDVVTSPPLRLRRHRHPVGLPGRLRPGQLPRLRAVHLPRGGHLRPARAGEFGFSTAPGSRPRASARCRSGPATRTSPAVSRWTSRGRLRAERSVRLPGPGLPRAGRGAGGAAPLASFSEGLHNMPPAGRGRRVGQGRRRRRDHPTDRRTRT